MINGFDVDMLQLKSEAVGIQRADVAQLKTGARHTTPKAPDGLQQLKSEEKASDADSSETSHILTTLDMVTPPYNCHLSYVTNSILWVVVIQYICDVSEQGWSCDS
jgi:hypothetical protein